MGPEAVEGFLALDSGGLVNPAGLPDDWPLKEAQLGFYEAYQAKYGQPPDFFSAAGADLVAVLAEAMKQAGGPDDKAKVAQALINLERLRRSAGHHQLHPRGDLSGRRRRHG